MKKYDVVIIGAGFAGMYMLHRLRQRGMSAIVFEAGDDVGGTWYWNRYPGARCDVESMEYSYQFDDELQQEWRWSERYSAQPQILAYAQHVAERFELRSDIQFETRVQAMRYNEAEATWAVTTDDGDQCEAQFVVAATGCLSVPNEPSFTAAETFQGEIYHTGRWPHHDVDFTGKRVAVIGTGSSAIQAIPLIAEQASELFVFQRTPNYSVPAQNVPLDEELQQRLKDRYAELREANKAMMIGFGARYPRNDGFACEASSEERERQFQRHWELGGLLYLGAFGDLVLDPKANDMAADFVRQKIKATVKDPAVAEKLLPDSAIFCKRLCADTGYYKTFNRDNVSLVDVNEAAIETFTETGLRTAQHSYDVDVIIYATGFDAMTGALQRIDITGRGGLPLNEKWQDGPKTYLGLETAGFPNMFIVTGPGSPSVLTNMLPSIEQNVEFIDECIGYLAEHGLRSIEADEGAEEAWVAHVNEVADATVYPSCNSWYIGANIPGKPRVFLPLLGYPDYVAKCAEVAANGYEGFVTS
jgi:cation diffusion facilitator CzcD-associated flavoprotein CzcO